MGMPSGVFQSSCVVGSLPLSSLVAILSHCAGYADSSSLVLSARSSGRREAAAAAARRALGPTEEPPTRHMYN